MPAFFRAVRFSLLTSLALGALVTIGACTEAAGGGPVSGPKDAHCGTKVQPTSESACMGTAGSGGGGTGGGGTGGEHEHEHEHEEPAVMYNDEGDDDDCKYHLKWSASDVQQNADVTLTLTVTNKSDGSPATGAAPSAEIFLDDTHPAPNSDQKPTEGSAGTYTIGPVRFDAAGKWTVRFHYYETCSELSEASPHGHGAFYLDVP